MSQAGPSNLGGLNKADSSNVSNAAHRVATGSVHRDSRARLVSHEQWRVVTSKYFHDTASLVRCYNEAADDGEKAVLMEWFFEYISRFDNSTEVLRRCHWEAFLELGNIDCRGETEVERNFWLKWLESMFKKVNPSTPIAIESVELALRMIPRGAFADSLEPLSDMMNRLLDQLDPSRVLLVKQNFQALKPLLLSVHHVFVLMQKAGTDFLDQVNLFYKTVMDRLSKIKKEQSYYPIHYLTSLVKESFRRVEKKKPTALMGAFRRGISGVRSVLYVSTFVRRAVRLEFDLDALNAAIEDAARAIKPGGTDKSELYDRINRLNLLGIKCLLDEDSFDELCPEVETLLRDYPVKLFHAKSAKAVRYSVIREFQYLAAESKSEEMRDRCLEWLLDVAEKCELNGFASYTDIFEALLDALASTHSSANPTQKEAIEASIETMVDTKTRRLKDCYSSWLGDVSLDEKLCSTLRRSDESVEVDVLFDEVKREMAVYTVNEVDGVKEELKAYYKSSDFAEVFAFEVEFAKRHAKDLEFSLVRFEKVKKTEEETNQDKDTEAEENPTLRHHTDESTVTRSLQIEDFFVRRSLSEGEPEQDINKVLVFGYPGTGKTSVTKKLAYLWSIGEWGREFDYVFVVPVRNLGTDHYDDRHFRSERTLATAIANICFKRRGEQQQFAVLRSHIEHVLQDHSTLVVLDGLDERSGACKEIIEEAKHSPCRVLLLGRPFHLEDERRLVDYEAECLGLDDYQLLRLIRREVSDESADQLVSFLKSTDRIWQWMHVPITANILCFLWKTDRESVMEEKSFRCINSLYANLTMYVWKRYSSAHNVQQEDKEVFRSLSKIAFEALVLDKILIHPHLVSSNSSEPLKKMIQGAGFLLLKLEGNLYHFPHLTFQEYFAGLYLAWCIEEGNKREKAKAVKFIGTKKYNPRYEIVMRFLIEQLAYSAKITLDDLISIIDSEPRNILEWNHSLYKLWVIDGWISGSDPILITPELTDLEKETSAKVSEAIKKTASDVGLFNLILKKLNKCQKSINRMPTIQPDLSETFQTFSQSSQHQLRSAAARQATELAKAAPQMSQTIAEGILKLMGDRDWRVRSAAAKQAAELAKAGPQMSQTIAEGILKLMEDGDECVRHDAARQAGELAKVAPQMSQIIAEGFLKLMKDRDWKNRYFAVKQAGELAEADPQMSQTIVEGISELMEDEDEKVRNAAARLAGKLAKVAPQTSQITSEGILKLMGDEYGAVRQAAARAFSKKMGRFVSVETFGAFFDKISGLLPPGEFFEENQFTSTLLSFPGDTLISLIMSGSPKAVPFVVFFFLKHRAVFKKDASLSGAATITVDDAGQSSELVVNPSSLEQFLEALNSCVEPNPLPGLGPLRDWLLARCSFFL